MDTIIVSSSRSVHRNTQRIAEVLGEALSARVLTPDQATPAVLASAERIGFGSGVYWWKFDAELTKCIRRLPVTTGREAFIFATSGLPEPRVWRYTRRLGGVLERQGFRVAGAFTCRGLDTWGPFGMVGGVSKGHPDDEDVEQARQFAAALGD